ncbi:MAG TPA: hypothetical protein PLF40_28130 [Kofleriaceae bacterium]|nr:hypothetical protein [Kofleriaceae bacterium]
MEAAVQFTTAFASLEYEVMVQLRTDANAPQIENNLTKLNAMFHGLASGLHLSEQRKLEDKATVEGLLQPRIIFSIKQYSHATLGDLYRVYTSSHFRGDNTCFSNYYVATMEGGLKIIARYNICNECNGSGKHGSEVCDECDGIGWNLRGGTKLESIGDVVAERTFATPVERPRL